MRKFTKYPTNYVKASKTVDNDKELITIDYHGNTCALYKDTYMSGDTALFLYDLTDDELWGDLTINLPGLQGMFLQDFISKDVINKLSNVFMVLGEFPYNYGTYKMIGFKKGMADKIPTWNELCEMIQNDTNGVQASTTIKADSEYGRYPTIPDERFELKVWDPDMYEDIMQAIDNCCSSSMGQLYSQYFTIEGPYEERFDVIDVLKDFGVDWEET